MPVLTATGLIETARLRGWLPASVDSASDADILAQMTSETRLGLAALLKRVRAEYNVERAVLAMTSAGVYLPSAASGQNLLRVEWYDGARYCRLEQCSVDSENDNVYSGSPRGFYFSGSKLYVSPSAWSGNVRVTYQVLAPTLVASSSAVQIATVPGATTVTVAVNPLGWGTTLTLDVTRNAPGAATLAREQAVTRSGTTYTFSSTSGFAAGDWLSLTGESALPQLPPEALEVLALRVAANLAAQSGGANTSALQGLAQRAEADLLALLAPRGQTAVAIVSREAPGRGRGRVRWR